MNTVTYTLKNGTKIQQPINKESFFDERGRKRNEAQMHKLFADTAFDKRAAYYTIDSETDDSITKEKEIHFSKVDKKLAKAQYADFKRSNPKGFAKSLTEFQRKFVNTVTDVKKKIKMNLTNINLQ